MNNRRRRHAKRIRKLGGVRGKRFLVVRYSPIEFTAAELNVLAEFERMGLIERTK